MDTGKTSVVAALWAIAAASSRALGLGADNTTNCSPAEKAEARYRALSAPRASCSVRFPDGGGLKPRHFEHGARTATFICVFSLLFKALCSLRMW